MEKEKTTENKQESKQVISYHTFMFPFLYEMNKTTRKKFEKCCHPGWFADIWNPNEMNDAIHYNQYHYFNDATHNAIYMTKDSDDVIVRNLRFDLLSLVDKNPTANPKRENDRPKNDGNPTKYVIRKGETKYSLDVNAIRMKLYNTGIGILIFELENREYSEEKDIIRINDLGRRIYAPYYAYYDNAVHCSICADEVYLEIEGKKTTDGNLLLDKLRESAEEIVLADPIQTLFSNGKYHVTTKKTCAPDEICIEPVIDDRMFVACYYINDDFVDAMRTWDGENYRYITDAKKKHPFDNYKNDNMAHRLYTMIYVDGDGICCHSRNMLQDLLSCDHIYTRWLEYKYDDNEENIHEFRGSITGFSEYTTVCVAKKPAPHLIDAFLTQYVEMILLVLAQRASLLSFEYMISECTKGEKNYKVENIQKKYILFQSQILMKEVSPQQQGIELYDMLKKNLMIEKEQNEIKDQIMGLFEQKNFNHDRKENGILFWLSVLGIFEAVNTAVDIFSAHTEESFIFPGIKLGLIGITTIGTIFYYHIKK